MKEFREITIPGDVLDDDRLSPTAKILYGKIARLAYKNGYCWASNKFLDGTQSGNTASHNIKELEKCGYVTCIYENDGQDRKIYICDVDSRIRNNKEPPPPEAVTPPPEAVRPPTGNGETPPPETVNKQYKINIQNKHTNKTSECEKNKSHFIKLWQSNPDVFDPLARFKEPENFNAWWEKNDITIEMIDSAVKNFLDGIRNGSISTRFIPANPDTFILNGGIRRYQTPYNSRSPPEPVNDWSDFGIKG